MPSIQISKISGEPEVLQLSDYIFGRVPHQQAIHDVVLSQRAAMRQGTHKTKTRAEVSGGGKKPWKQKGTGNARQGSTRSPQWYHGGIVFGPYPHKYHLKVNKQVRRLALFSALSYHLLQKSLVIVDNLDVDKIKTKALVELLKKYDIKEKALILDLGLETKFIYSARNIASISINEVDHASVYDLLNCKQLVLTKKAVNFYEETYKHE